MSNATLDFVAFRADLKATKPPYECPIAGCAKLYRSLAGMLQHLDQEERLLKNGRKRGRSRAIVGPRRGRRQNDKNLVVVDLGGQLIRFDTSRSLKLVSTTENGKRPASVTILKAGKSAASQKNHGHDSEGGEASLPEAMFKILDAYVRRSGSPGKDEVVLYDADEEDLAWLELMNEDRVKHDLQPISRLLLERILDAFERLCHFERRRGHAGSDDARRSESLTRDEDAVCCVCLDGECLSNNVILFCDLCNLAVHQECYGVPHIPDGPWICRRCLLSPSRAVDCCLCPSKVGALKQTDDGRWAHVVCALWIPDAGFANSVFLEPIDGVGRIQQARWKLTCQVCRRRSAGACIQCCEANCYAAFHVTCARRAGFHMRIEPSSALEPPRESPDMAAGRSGRQEPLAKFFVAQSGWSKTVYCNAHAPSRGSSGRKEMALAVQRVRRSVREGKEVLPFLSYPALDEESYEVIRKSVDLPDGPRVAERLKNYWLLKRRERNGVPLVTHPGSYCLREAGGEGGGARRGGCGVRPGTTEEEEEEDDSMEAPKARTERSKSAIGGNDYDDEEEDDDNDDEEDEEEDEGKKELMRMKRLRQELERVRLLNELIKKRERLKLRMFHQDEQLLAYKLNPVRTLYEAISSASENRGMSCLLTDDDDDDDVDDDGGGGKEAGGGGGSMQSMSEIVRKVEALEYDSVGKFAEDFERFCEAKRARVDPRRRKKVNDLKRMGLTMIRRFVTEAVSLDSTTSSAALDSERGMKADASADANGMDGVVDLNGDMKPQSTGLDRSPSTPFVVPSSVPSKSSSSSSSNRLAIPVRPPKKRRLLDLDLPDASWIKREREELAVVEAPPNGVEPPSNGIEIPSDGAGEVDENDNLRLLAETADSISSENSYSVDPNVDNGGLFVMVSNGSFETIGHPNRSAVQASNQPQSSSQSCVVTQSNATDGQSKTIEACDSTTDWPCTEEVEASPDGNLTNQKGRSKSSRKSNQEKSRKRSQSNETVNGVEESDIHNGDEGNDVEKKAKRLRNSAAGGKGEAGSRVVARRNSRRKSTEAKAVEDFLVLLNHGDFVWAQYAKFPAYPAIIIDPSKSKREGGNRPLTSTSTPSTTTGRTSRNQEVAVGVDLDDVIPVPAADVVEAKSDREKYLVCFFDQKRTWQWVSRSKLDPLGVDSGLDGKKILAVKRFNSRRPVVEAYKRALRQRCIRYKENYTRSLAVVLDQLQ